MLEFQSSGQRPSAGVYILISFLTFLVFTTGCSTSVTPPPLTQTYCQKFERYLASQGFEYGVVEVPEDYENPQGSKINVFFYRQKNIPGTPIAVFNGGPGSSSHMTFQALREQQARRSQWEKIPFVYIDQRGTGCSTPYPVIIDQNDFSRVAKYASRSIVRDSEAIRQKLYGDKPWKLFGQSYGGQIVHRYIVDYPKSIVSAHIHGSAVGVYGEEGFLRRIKSQHRVIEEYLRRFPEDREVLNKLSRDLNDKSCFPYKTGDTNINFCGPIIVHHLVKSLGFTDQWTSLHTWLADFLTPSGELNTSVLQDFVNQDVGPIAATDQTAWSSTISLIIMQVDFAEGGLTVNNCRAVEAKIRSEVAERKPWQIDECRHVLNQVFSDEELEFETLLEKSVAEAPADVISIEALREAIDQNGLAGKVYLYSGEHDTFVPRELFAEEVSALGARVRYHHFQSSGHEGFLEPLVWKNLLK